MKLGLGLEMLMPEAFTRSISGACRFAGAMPGEAQSNDMSSTTASLNPKCVATTGDTFNKPVERHTQYDDQRSNLFRHAKFSADGTTIITQNEDHCLRTFVLPTDLLDGRDELHNLELHCHLRFGSNVQTFDILPQFDLQDPSTTLVLSASSEVPITLRNALHYGTVHASYHFINAPTEQHRSVRSLAFTPNGTHFIAGSNNIIAAFDVSRPESGPVSDYLLRPSRKSARTGAVNLTRKGLVSAMSIGSDGLMAVGTSEREIALFENDGLGQCISAFSLETLQGTGVTGLQWSPCGKYLLVAERSSDAVQVFDIRDTGQEVARLMSRNAKTSQVLDISIVPTAEGFEVWAGGMDGIVRMWSNPGSQDALHTPDGEFKMHQSPVASAIWHPSGAVLATCSGERGSAGHVESESDSEDEIEDNRPTPHEPDNSLKIWTV